MVRLDHFFYLEGRPCILDLTALDHRGLIERVPVNIWQDEGTNMYMCTIQATVYLGYSHAPLYNVSIYDRATDPYSSRALFATGIPNRLGI